MARAEAYLRVKFHLDPSNRLATIHQRHGQDRTDKTGQTDRQRSDSIGRTVLQTVAQKLCTCYCFDSVFRGDSLLMFELSIHSYKATLCEPERLALDSVQECAEKK